MQPCVFAIAAHPDDIEFSMAGTLLLLKRAGCEIHYMNLSKGSCGSREHDAETTAAIRLIEAQNAAARMGAVFHHPLTNDFEIYYEKNLLARLGSIIRSVAPDILLIPSPQDYMEDHTNTCRLAVSAAFSRAMVNLPVDPPQPAIFKDIVLYHAQPFGNRDGLNRLIIPDLFVNIGDVLEEKRAALSEHKSQKNWLDESQAMDSYLDTMVGFAREMGDLSGQCQFAEGWRRHNPLGMCDPRNDPVCELLSPYVLYR